MVNRKDKKPEKVMQIERFLSQTKVMVVLILIMDLFFFFAGNFIFNSVARLPEMLKDLDNPKKIHKFVKHIAKFQDYR